MRRFAFFSALILFLATTVVAKGPKIADPKKVDADYAFQGEYAGMTDGDDAVKVGVQVIALGKGKFRAVAYFGGLPGAGWNKEAPIQVEGSREGDQVEFASDQGKGIVKGGELLMQDPDGRQIGKLKKVVRKSPTLGKKPPQGAVVLFNGKDVDGWEKGRMTKDGLLMQGTRSKDKFGDQTLHIEFRLPYQPEDRGQGRGNSGLYLQGRYEVQMLDSFGLTGEHNECGGVYSVKKPDVNMCLPPLVWQTYDVDYTAAKYKDGKLISGPRMTVRHNGVVIHKDVELPGGRSTTAAPVKPGPDGGPIYLQNHGCPVRYRNIWVVRNSTLTQHMVRVEFFGIPRRRAGKSHVDVAVSGAEIRLGDVLRSLAASHPQWAQECLVGDRLRDGFVVNLDGERFVQDPEVRVQHGTCILIMTADAGG